ncbi:MAG: hypothetical protein GXO79_02365 [Chlorobi bacterium]|nr:hypothetical protein [Chlorobiota bacterium]
MEKEEYRRHLPHIQPKEGVFFITFRLYGSLPVSILQKLKEEKEINIIRQRKQFGSKKDQMKKAIRKENEQYNEVFNSMLDNPKSGTTYLANKTIAKIVANSIHFLDGKDYKLICYTIMSNHVHMIIYKIKKPLFKILQSLKRYTAREANKIINTQGSFWQKESYDNLINSRNELANKIKYVVENPVKINLVKNWEDWEFSYCNPEFLHFLLD